jgi:serine/threonine protein kinase
MECYDGGNLMQYRRNRKNYSEVAAACHIKQALSAVDYMHSCNVAHRDLKTENMLLASMLEDADLKIADFGLAVVFATDSCTRCMKRITSIKEAFVGSPFCMAPEVAIRDAAYGPQCDIWSIGCIAYELLDGRPPFRGKSITGIYNAIHTSLGPSFDKQVWTRHSHEARDFCGHMLQKKPEVRYDAQEALEDVWISSAE